MKLLELLLRLYPEKFRLEHEREIYEFIHKDLARVDQRFVERNAFWIRTYVDLAWGAARLRSRQRASRQTSLVERRSSGAWQDLVFGLRALASTPFVSLVVVLTLGLGIGLSSAIFNVVHDALLQPFDYERPERLFVIDVRWVEDGVEHAKHSSVDFNTLRDGSRTFDDIAAVVHIRQNLTGLDVPLQVQVGWASENLFRVLGVSMILGPGFVEIPRPERSF